MPDYQPRPFQEDDRVALVEIGNRDRPPHRHDTVEGWAFWDSMKPAGVVELRLVVPDPDTGNPIASVGATDLNTTPGKMEDVVGFGVSVAHEHRRRGLGAMLYDRAAAFATERGAKRMVTGFSERSLEEPAIAFLTGRGFAEMEREKPSYLDLKTWDPAPFLPAIARAEAAGVRLLTYADVEDTEENRRRVYDLFVPIIYDIPRRDTQPFTIEPFEEFIKMLSHPKWTPELFQLAEVDGEWVGMSHVMPKFHSQAASQWLTGVRKDQRGKGIALAMKVCNYRTAKERGHSVITTENHEDNSPMLAVNQKFGFIPEPHDVMWNKNL